MSNSSTTSPKRLRAGGTELERRVLGAASREEPSRELFERMAAGIGVAPPALTGLEPGSFKTQPLAGKSAALSQGTLAWVSGAVLALGLGAAVLLGRSPAAPHASAAQGSATVARSAEPLPAVASVASVAKRADAAKAPLPPAEIPSVVRTAPALRPSAATTDLRDQIRLIDAARAAMSAGEGSRVLDFVRQYQSRYTTGSFVPEAAALKIEALMKLNRSVEARALAQRFVTDYRGTALASRVARLTGVAQRP